MDDVIIYLDSDEEITAVIDRLRSSDAGSIRFVIPKGALVLQSLVSLKLLRREASQAGKQIAIVTQDPVGLHLGEQANITVFAKPKDIRPIFTAQQATARNADRSSVDVDSEDERYAADAAHDNLAATANKHDLNEPSAADSFASADQGPDGNEADEDIDSDIHVHRYDQADRPPIGARAQDLVARSKASVRPRTHRSPTRLIVPLIILLFLGATGYLVFAEFAPRATIAVTLATEPLNQKVTVTARGDTTAVDVSNAVIPAKLVEADVTVTESLPATGKKQVGEKATATLAVSNYWDANPQLFAAGTIFTATDSTNFVSTAAVTVPGAVTTLKEGKVVTTPGKANVTIQAQLPGPQANGKSGRFTIPALSALRQEKIYGESIAPTAGGTAKEVTIASEADIQNLMHAAKAKLAEAGSAKLTEAAAGELVLNGASEQTLSEETYSHKAGAETETVTANITAKVRALVFADADLDQAATEVLKRSVPANRTLVLEASDQLVASVSKLELQASTLVIQVDCTSRTAAALDTSSLLDQITNQPVTIAQERLRAQTGVVTAQVTLRPRWLTKLPKHDSQVTLTINYQR